MKTLFLIIKYGLEEIEFRRSLQGRCWGKPGTFQRQVWKEFGYYPSPNGWKRQFAPTETK